MKKSKILVSVLLCLVLVLTGCGGSKVGKEAVSQGKIAMAQKEYEKSLGSLKLAKAEGIKDKEVESMVKILNSYLDGKKLLSEGKLEEARDNIEFIDKEYEKYQIKEDVDSLKLEFDIIDETLEKEDTVIKLLNEKNNTEAMEVLGTISSSIEKYFSIEEIKDKKGEIDGKLSEIEVAKAKEKAAAEEKAKKEKAAKAAKANTPVEIAKRSLLRELSYMGDIYVVYTPKNNFYGTAADIDISRDPVVDYAFEVYYANGGSIGGYYVSAWNYEILSMDVAHATAN